MAKNNKTTKESTTKLLIRKFDINNLSKEQKTNILLGFCILIAISILTAQPIIKHIENIIVDICNTAIIIITNSNENILESKTVTSKNTSIICLIILFIETIICMIFCYCSKKEKDNNPDDK